MSSRMTTIGLRSILLLSCYLFVTQCAEWKPSPWEQCRTNADCNNTRTICCSITPALGRRRVLMPLEVNYCLPYKTAASPWCSLRLQYSPSTPNYHGLCPCGPGLRCVPSADLDPKSYSSDRYGKCVQM